MSSNSKTQLEVAATGISFEQIRVCYFTELNQHTRANEQGPRRQPE